MTPPAVARRRSMSATARCRRWCSGSARTRTGWRASPWRDERLPDSPRQAGRQSARRTRCRRHGTRSFDSAPCRPACAGGNRSSRAAAQASRCSRPVPPRAGIAPVARGRWCACARSTGWPARPARVWPARRSIALAPPGRRRRPSARSRPGGRASRPRRRSGCGRSTRPAPATARHRGRHGRLRSRLACRARTSPSHPPAGRLRGSRPSRSGVAPWIR